MAGKEEDDLGRKTASGGPEAENAPGGGRGKALGGRKGAEAAPPAPFTQRVAREARRLARARGAGHRQGPPHGAPEGGRGAAPRERGHLRGKGEGGRASPLARVHAQTQY